MKQAADGYAQFDPAQIAMRANETLAIAYLKSAASALLRTAADLANPEMRAVVRSRNDLPSVRFAIDCAETHLLRDAQPEYGECLADGGALPDPFVNQPRPA